jgi:KTSC domain
MELKAVISSNILKIGYDEAKLHLGVVFKKSPNKLYILHPFEKKSWLKFEGAESLGKFYNANIKENKRYSIHTEVINTEVEGG